MHVAARAGQVGALRALLLAGADADLPLSRRPASSPLLPLPEGAQQESVSDHVLSVRTSHPTHPASLYCLSSLRT